jgi:hypothetical protein
MAALVYVISDGGRAALLLLGARAGGLPGLAWGGAAWAAFRVLALATAIAAGAIPIARPRFASLRRQIAYAVPFAGSVALAVTQKQMLQYSVAASFDAAVFAAFAVASFHLPVVDIVYSPVGEVLMLELGRAGDGGGAARRRAWDEAVSRLAEILFPATACAFLFGDAVLPLLFGGRYRASVPMFLLASCEIPLWVFPVDALLRAGARTRFLFGWNAARLPLSATAVLGGIAIAGVPGAIAGGVISEAVSRLVMLGAGRSVLGLGVGLAALLPPSLWRIAAAAVAAAPAGWLARGAHAGPARVALAAAAYGACYFALRRALRPSSDAERALLARGAG